MTSFFAGWGEMSLAFFAFFASHILPARPAVRRILSAQLGAGGYARLYSLVSLAVLAWLIVAARKAPHVSFGTSNFGSSGLPISLCLRLPVRRIRSGRAKPVFHRGARRARASCPNGPASRASRGIRSFLAITLWAAAHVIPNGDLAHVILFGLFAVFGIVGMAALDGRRRREWGEERWAELAAKTSLVPFAAISAGRMLLASCARSSAGGCRACALSVAVCGASLIIGVRRCRNATTWPSWRP